MTRALVGALLIAFGVFLAVSPLTTASVLARPHETASQMINLRASFGGPLLGIGAFVIWVRALRPYRRAIIGLIGWSMAGIAAARGLGFALDGSPDGRQWLWMSLEVAMALGAVAGLRFVARRRR